MNNKNILTIACVVTLFASVATAELYDVEIKGTVAFNAFVPSHPLGGIPAGAAATTSLRVDSNDFLNSPSFPVRGYRIIPSSFLLKLGTSEVLLADPPGNVFFSLRNNDPAVDGFLVSSILDFPNGVPTNFNNVRFSYLTSYPQTTLSSLNIADAVGTYDFTGISQFEFGLQVFGSPAIEINYERLTISVVPEPTAAVLLPLACLVCCRR